MTTKIIIAGSRVIPNREFVLLDLSRRIYDWGGIEIVCGMARGADLIGKEWAEEAGYPVKAFPADWDKHGRSAGYIRNKEMSEYADELIAYWDGKSNGTKNMIDLMQAARKPTTIIYV